MGTWGIGIFQDDHALDQAADVVEAPDPLQYLESLLRKFLDDTAGGYDQSAYAEDWMGARKVLSVLELVRVARHWEGRGHLPEQVERWLPGSRFRPTDAIWALAAEVSRRLVDSRWLRDDWPELHAQVIVPQHLALTSESEPGDRAGEGERSSVS